MVLMTNYQDFNQSQQEYVNNDDYTDRHGRHDRSLLTLSSFSR